MKMLLPTARAAVVFGAAWLSTTTHAQIGPDDSVWLNANIKAAIAAGAGYYTIPAGTFNLYAPLIVPRGTKHFTLRGSGMDRTILRSPIPRQRLVEVGEAIMPHNNWGLTDKTNNDVEAVDEGSTIVKLSKSGAILPGNYVLWDEHRIVNRYGGGDTHNRAEIVKVLAYDRSTNSVTLEEPVGRDFLVLPKLADFNAALCLNITVSNMTLDGMADDGQSSTDLLYASGVKVFYLNSVRIGNYANGAAYVNVCKNSLISNCVIDPATAGGVGAGYGLTITRSRFTTIRNTWLNWSQALKFHTGAMDSLVEDCVTTQGGNAIDAHGFDELRVTIRRCTGNGGITLGNEAWAAGGKGHRVEDCNLQFLFIGPNATDVLVRRSKFKEALSLSDLNPAYCSPLANPMGGRPGILRFEDTEFTAAQNVINDFRWYDVEDATFTRCLFSTTNTSFGNVIKLTGARGSLGFYSCEFRPAANREAIEIATGQGNNLRFVMKGCVIRSKVGLDVGLWLQPVFKSQVVITDNELVSKTKAAGATFLKNEAVAPGDIRNNKVVRR